MDQIILVDEHDKEIGTMEKMEAHRQGVLHRAFSIVLLNSRGELLLQKRSKAKYHSGGLWTNTCCSHPLPEEPIGDAARKRLKYEMGIDLQPEFVYKFIYKATLDGNLTEHEYDHVFIGWFNGTPEVNPEEVEDWKFITLDELRTDMNQHAENYTAWFKLMVNHTKLIEAAASARKKQENL